VKRNSEAMITLAVELVESLMIKFSSGLSSVEAEKLLNIHGLNVQPKKKIPKWYIFVSQLWQPMPKMIWLTAIIEAAI
jgi:hypothetical protein